MEIRLYIQQRYLGCHIRVHRHKGGFVVNSVVSVIPASAVKLLFLSASLITFTIYLQHVMLYKEHASKLHAEI